MKKIIQKLLLLLLFFYYTYPQALDTFGSSFIILPGALGLILYILHGFPFKEVILVLLAFGLFVFTTFFSSYINAADDLFISGYMRSHIAWLFSAYLLVFLVFKIHDNPKPTTIAAYLVAAITLQCILTLVMYFSESALEFLSSLELASQLNDEIREEVEGTRLIGYGIGFFGAGFIAGYGLILTTYILTQAKLNRMGMIFLAIVYVFIFYVGIFSARTVTVGASISIILVLIYYIMDYGRVGKRVFLFGVSFLVLLITGYSLAYVYFPSMTSWAFELFDNFVATGKFQTKSSDALSDMFYFPEDLKTFIYGKGETSFWKSDVGYTRLVFYYGIIGMCAYFFYPMVITKLSFSKDKYTNLLLISFIIYELILNIKGFTDLNSVLYLFFFFFMFYKYYKFKPKIYARQLQSKQFRNPQ